MRDLRLLGEESDSLEVTQVQWEGEEGGGRGGRERRVKAETWAEVSCCTLPTVPPPALPPFHCTPNGKSLGL